MDQSLRRLWLACGAAVAAVAVWSVLQWRTPATSTVFTISVPREGASVHGAPSDSEIGGALGRFSERLPFDDPAYGLDQELVEPLAAAEPVEAAPMETLVVRGVVLGAVGEAIIDGIPGDTRSRTLRVGERFGGVLLVRVSALGAVVQVEQARRELLLSGGQQ